jgi:hypothetical protein
MPLGTFRRVFLIGGLAIKVPRFRRLRRGMLCNRWETEMWRIWRLKFDWPHLCPILFADPLGMAVVMPRATQPVTSAEIEEADPDIYPDITAECKPEDWGRVHGRIVALDYCNLFEADDIREKREYYERTERR